MSVEKIVEYVTIFLSSGVGAAILGAVIRSIALAVSNAKQKKYSKLTEDDKKAIAEEVKNELFKSMQSKLTLDANAIVDKATNSRLSALESSYNEIVKAVNQSTAYSRATMNAVGDFKTISEDSRAIIKNLLKDEVAKVDEVVDQKVVEIKFEKEEAKEAAEVKTESKVSY